MKDVVHTKYVSHAVKIKPFSFTNWKILSNRCAQFFLKIKNSKNKHDISPHAQKNKQTHNSRVREKLKHRLNFENTKNSQTGFNSLSRTYYVQTFAAKTRVEILSFIREVMLKSHTDSCFSYKSCHCAVTKLLQTFPS